MRFAFLCLLAVGAFSVAHAQVVIIRNVSAPYTQLEVGNTVEVVIAGAPASKDVYLDYTTDSYPPFYMGQTNSSGIWTTQAVETPTT